ncbi:uncharacterized protein LOC131857616 [Cryptomeria japonica]|uniref:uncharacterized protein LOC131857616 n=1 Tax=Cryptomeria japonica TaxID=3369 RepID=UPI0027D9ED1F|nr:uncharacterized protein LOC131857616 [Cryptomeria japonica]
MAEVLGRNIKKHVSLGLWRGISIHENMEPISHSQFANDTILFGEATVREAITIWKVLDCFESDSSQSMNKNKSMVFFLNTSKRLRSRISKILEFEPGRASSSLDGFLKKFLWEGSKEDMRIPLINWDTACMIKEEGGAGLRKMNLQNLALGAKLAWKKYKFPKKLWCRILVAKYLDSNSRDIILTVANSVRGSLIWRFIWESCKLLTYHLTWKIDNGKRASFWHDSWNGDEPLENLFKDKDWVNQIEAYVGSWVADYFEILPNSSSSLSWKSVGDWHQINHR